MSPVRFDRPAVLDETSSRAGAAQRGGDDGLWARLRRLRWEASEWFADLRSAVAHALGAISLGVAVCVGLVVLGWVADPASATPWPQAVRMGLDVWLLTHLGSLDTASMVATSVSPADPPTLVTGSVSLAPLGLTLCAAALAWRAGRRLAARRGPVGSLVLSAGLAGTYAASAWVIAWWVDTVDVRPDPETCAVAAGLLALVAGVAGALGPHARDLLDRLPVQVSAQLRRVLPATVVAVVAWLSGGALLLTTGLLLSLPDLVAVQDGLAPGLGGGLLLLLGQLAVLPTAVVWASAVLAGPGTRLGTGGVDLAGSSVTDVPAVPLLAALPDPGSFPLWTTLGAGVVVLAGALAAWHSHRHPSSTGATTTDRLADAVAVAALSGIVTAGLAFVASGSLGPWGPLGPELLPLTAAVVAEVFVGAAVCGAVLHLLSGRPVTRWQLPSGLRLPAWRGRSAPPAAPGAGRRTPGWPSG